MYTAIHSSCLHSFFAFDSEFFGFYFFFLSLDCLFGFIQSCFSIQKVLSHLHLCFDYVICVCISMLSYFRLFLPFFFVFCSKHLATHWQTVYVVFVVATSLLDSVAYPSQVMVCHQLERDINQNFTCILDERQRQRQRDLYFRISYKNH